MRPVSLAGLTFQILKTPPGFEVVINKQKIPKGVVLSLAIYSGTGKEKKIFIYHELADFTSGMSDDPTNLPRGLEQRSIEHYTVNDFLTWASNYEPTTQLPAPYRYSNAGIGLLSYLIATATGKTWEDQVNSEIVQPLGMADTTLRPTPEQQKRLAQGHSRAGQDAPRWPVFAWYAAGGLRSTAQEMISFGEANLGHKEVNGKPVSAELIAAMQLAQKPIHPMPKRQQAGDGLGEQYGPRQSEPASGDCEERRNVRIRHCDRD